MSKKRINRDEVAQFEIENLLWDAKQQLKSSRNFLIIYSVILVVGYVIWITSSAKYWGTLDYFAVIGAIVIALLAFLLFGRFYRKIYNFATPEGGAVVRSRDFSIFFIICIFAALVATAFVIMAPIALVLTVIEFFSSAFAAWLTAPIHSLFEMRLMRLVACICSAFPHIYYGRKYIKNKRLIETLKVAEKLETYEESSTY